MTKSVIMEDTSRGWGAPIWYSKLTPEEERKAKRMSRSLKKYGFTDQKEVSPTCIFKRTK